MIASARFTSDVDLADVIKRIAIACPGTITISDDYYRDRLKRVSELSAETGLDPDSRPMQCMRDVASRVGRQYRIRIQLTPNSAADARIDSRGALIVTLDDSGDIARQQLIEVLAQFPAIVDFD